MASPLVRSAQSEEHEYWTDPILCEETRARLEQSRSAGWLPPNFKPNTLKDIAVVERYWRKFCIQSNEDYDEYWRRLCQYFELFSRRRVGDNAHKQMRRYLEGPFPAERKIPRRTKDKNTLDVDVFCVIYRHHWVHSRFFRHGSMVVQFATVQLWSAITGTRPGVLLSQNISLPGDPSSLGKRKRAHAFQSDLPKYISMKDLPESVCYRDIELFYLKHRQSKRDVLCAIIEFRNLKGRPEGADGTRFFMHGDYQLVYCPIAQIVSFAFRDGAFVNSDLTPELIWRLRDPKHQSSLPLRWKPEVPNTPLLRRFERTPYGYELHGSLAMTYESSRQALKELGRDARFEDDIGHYNFRRWTANEVNLRSGKECLVSLATLFLKSITNHNLLDAISRMLFFFDRLRKGYYALPGVCSGKGILMLHPSSPKRINVLFVNHTDILQLRREKRELRAEMISLAGSIKNTREPFPHLYQKHENVTKDISKLRKRLATDTREAARKDHFQNAPVLEVDRQIKQLLGEFDEVSDDENTDNESWELPVPDYVFAERARLVENFYGPDAENFDEDKLLARRIQVTKDMVALMQLNEPSRRGNRVNWDVDDEYELLDQSEILLCLEEDTMECPTNICIICCGLSRQSSSNSPPHKFPHHRQDSLRRHLIDMHPAHARNGISCNWESCRNVPQFSDITKFLAHASTEHSYDIKLKLCHLPQISPTSCSDVSSREVSFEMENRQMTETPASSIDLELKNIDPRLLEAPPLPITMALPNPSDTELLSCSGGSPSKDLSPNSAETLIRRSTRSTAKVTENAPAQESESQPQHVKRSSRKTRHAEKPQRGEREENKGLNSMKASKKPPLRR
ncbi:uncharacterized protein N7484_002961 [Penicillium longicatenatum]|uniref:uncharacterized protein n=1 Tax=Penicillium longicatenatum TaxID=1561947 RepID=UPI0025465F27|nr:uncharacterized protein N7484_002961 [Penicillium longicatenatum]KAJ5649238.1 hypothetical protein N7484_002961 [Penicillium longicatenatum]